MSYQYDQYLVQHKANVGKGFIWLRDNLPEIIPNDGVNYEAQICQRHDLSKTDAEEYNAYDAYFYSGNRSFAVVQDFRYAWLRHIHMNSHHWQHCVLIQDDPDEGAVCMPMPYKYILEMICDWWSFSWANGDPNEIFDWYDQHKDYMQLHDTTRQTVDKILGLMKEKMMEVS